LALFLNVCQNMFYLITITMNVILHEPTIGAKSSLVAQTGNAAWCLFGIPFILSGIYGLYYKLEQNMRVYFWYMTTCLGMDIIYVCAFFYTSEICSTIPDALLIHGAAAACGIMTAVTYAYMAAHLILTTYFMFTVWSYCEDLKGSGLSLQSLLNEAGDETLANKRMAGWIAKYEKTSTYGSLFGEKNYGVGGPEGEDRSNYGVGWTNYSIQNLDTSGRQTISIGEDPAVKFSVLPTPQTKQAVL